MTNQILEKFKDVIEELDNGKLLYSMVESAYNIGYTQGCIDTKEKYSLIVENTIILSELIKEHMKTK